MKYNLRILLYLLFLCAINAKAQDATQNPQWYFLKNTIPDYKSITISGSGWSMTINDKYKVTFTGEYNNSSSDYSEMSNYSMSENATFRGTGIVIWDTDRMRIKLKIQANGNYHYKGEYYKYVRTKIKGSTTANIAWGMLTGNYDAVDEYRTEKQFSHSVNDYADGSKIIEYASDIIVDPNTGKLKISGSVFSLPMTGNTSRNVSLKISEGWYAPTSVSKTEAELSSSKDEFGEWNWNADRTKIYLKSLCGDNLFVIWNIDGQLSWSMEMEKEIKGISETITEKGDSITHLSMSFDGEPALNLQFAKYCSHPTRNMISENKIKRIEKTLQIPVRDELSNEIVNYRDSIYYVDSLYTVIREELVYNKQDELIINNKDENKDLFDYVTYNRFTGILSKNSATVLNDIKDKQMLILSYSVNNEEKSDMFSLEGLESILNYLTQQE